MKSYTKAYLKFFGYDENDFIPCSVCGAKAVDIHHIEVRTKGKEYLNDIYNLIALCRKHHTELGDRKQYKEFLSNLQKTKILEHLRKL